MDRKAIVQPAVGSPFYLQIARKVIEAFEEDFVTEGMRNTVYQDRKERAGKTEGSI